MRVYELLKGSTSLDGLRAGERPEPKPGPREVLIRIRAVSLNYRDHLIVTGKYYTGVVDRDVIPLSDGAGEVVSLGPGVGRFKTGDRVAGAFFQVWKDGPRSFLPPALGVPLDGVLAEYVALHEDGVVAIPPGLSYEEAAALPCAGVTAWNALMVAGPPVKPGDTVLCQGTGGVSMLAMQFAKAAGARVIVSSSSDEKLRRVLAMGASRRDQLQTPSGLGEGSGPADGRARRGCDRGDRRRGRVAAIVSSAGLRREGGSDRLPGGAGRRP